MMKQNNELYKLKSEFNLLHHEDPQLVIEKGNELEKKFHLRKMMIIGEGVVFMLLLAGAFAQVRNTFKKEVALADQQTNFMHSITHELKSPVASIKLSLETLKLRELEKEKQLEILSNALHDTDRLNHLLENILLAAQIENYNFQIHPEPINISDLTHTLLKSSIQTFNTHSFTQSIQPNLIISIDKSNYYSIFLNLIENSVKYSPPGSLIKIFLEKREGLVLLSVCDQGIGISDDEKQNIFKKFYRIGKEEIRKTKGTGLGLFIVKYLVEKNKGAITLKNNIPKGSIFEISFYG